MRTGQNAHFAPDGAHFGQFAAVGAHALVDDVAAHDFLLQAVERVADLDFAALELLGKVLGDLGLDLLFAGVALIAVEGLEHPLDLVHGVFAHGGLDVLAGQNEREFLFLLADLSNDGVDQLNDLLDLLVGEEYAAEHDFLGDFLRAGLDHQNGLGGAGHGEVEQRFFALFIVGVDDVLAVHIADVDRADGAGPRDLAGGQRGRSADHRRDVGDVVGVHGHDGGHHGHVVAHALGEERAQRAVDEAGGEDGLLGGTALAAVPAAGDVAHGVELFFKIHAQGEEVDARARGLGHGAGGQHAGVAIADEARAGGLFGVLAELERERAAAQLHGVGFEHADILLVFVGASAHGRTPAR